MLELVRRVERRVLLEEGWCTWEKKSLNSKEDLSLSHLQAFGVAGAECVCVIDDRLDC